MARDNTIRTIFAIDGEQKYTEAIAKINNSQKTLQSEMAKATSQLQLTGDKQEFARQKAEILNKQIELQKQKINEARAALEKSNAKFGENSEASQRLTRDLNYAEAGLTKLEKSLKDTTLEMKRQESAAIQLGRKLEESGKKVTAVGEKMSDAGGKMSLALSAPIAAGAAYAAKSAMDFESSFAGVRKTVDATEEEFAGLERGIRDMALELPASASSIAGVAEAAGQLGIKKENILDFTRTIVDLGEATNIVGSEGASQLAQFANVVQMSQKDFSRFGSALVDLGNNAATTERDILNMAMRLAGAGKQAGLSEPEILGLATSMASVGIEAEAGGSAMSKLLINMQVAASVGEEANKVIDQTGYSLRDLQMMQSHSSKEFGEMADAMGYTKEEFGGFIDAAATLEGFSKVTGQTGDQFKKSFQEDAVGALQTFIAGLGRAKDSGKDAVTVLDEMGITEVRLRDTILRTVNAGDLMNEMVDLSNKAWEENNALTEEASKRYETSESRIAIAKNRLNEQAMVIGEKLLPVAVDLVERIANLASGFADLDPEMQATILSVLGFVAAAGPALKITGELTKGIGGAMQAVGKISQKFGEASVASDGLTKALGTAGTLGAIGLLVGGVALLVKAYQVDLSPEVKRLTDEVKRSEQAYEDNRKGIESNTVFAGRLTDQIEELADKENKSALEKAQLVALIGELNKMMPGLNVEYKEESDTLSKSADSIRRYIDNRKEELMLRAAEDRWIELQRESLDLEERLEEAKRKNTAATERLGDVKKAVTQNEFHYNKEVRQTQKDIDELTKEQEKNKASLDSIEKKYGEAITKRAENNAKINESNQQSAAVTEQTQEQQAQAVKESAEAQIKERERLTKEQERISKQLEQSYDNHMKAMGGIDQNGIQTSKLTAKEVKRNLENQIKDYQNWQASIQKAAQRVPPDVLNELKKLGPQYAPIINDLNKMSDRELSAWVATWRSKAALAEKSAIEELQSAPGEATKIGANFGQGFANGINSKKQAVRNASAGLASTASDRMRVQLREQSPSKETTEIGEFAGEGLAIGLLNKIRRVGAASQALAQIITDGIAPANGWDFSGQLERLKTASGSLALGVPMPGGAVTTNSSALTVNINSPLPAGMSEQDARKLGRIVAEEASRGLRAKGALI